MPRRHSHDAAVAGKVVTRRRRTPVLLDQPACCFLRGSTTGHASALPAGRTIPTHCRYPSDRHPGRPSGEHDRHGTGCGARHDLHQCSAISTPADRCATIAGLPELPVWPRGPEGDFAKPAIGMACHMPFLWGPFQVGAEHDNLPSPFCQYRDAALRGEKLLDDEAERGIRTWTSPSDIARLLLMRRVTWPPPREKDLWCFRVLGAIVPDLDHVIATEQENLPTPAGPILPLRMRPALLAGAWRTGDAPHAPWSLDGRQQGPVH